MNIHPIAIMALSLALVGAAFGTIVLAYTIYKDVTAAPIRPVAVVETKNAASAYFTVYRKEK